MARPSLQQAKAPVASPLKRGIRFQTFSSLRYRNFRYLWTSTLFTSAGQWIEQVTLGWLAYDMTGSPLMVGAMQGVRAIPFLVAGPIGGVLADRIDRRRLLLGIQVFLAAMTLAFAIALAAGQVQIGHLFAYTFLVGIGWAVNNPVRQALVPATVPREGLMNAIALNSAAFNVNRVVGPAAGGLIIAAFGAATNFFLKAATYMGVIVAVYRLRLDRQDFASTSHASVLSNLAEGLRYVAKEETTLALILMAMIPSLFIMPFTSGLMPVVAAEVFHSERGVVLGLLLSFFGLGALLGTLALATLGDVRRKGRLLVVAALLAGVVMILFSYVAWLPLALGTLMVLGAAHMFYMATNNTILQTITPDAMRGRVMSIFMADHGLVPLGSLVAGAIAEFYGSPAAILVGGIATVILVLLVGFRLKAVWNA